MYVFKIITVCTLLTTNIFFASAQNYQTKNSVENSREKIEWLTTNAKEYRDLDTIKSLQYLKQAERLSTQFNYPDLLSITYATYAFYYDKDDNPSNMKLYASKALEVAQLSNDNRALGYAYMQYAYAKGINGNEFIDNLLKAEYYLLKTTDYKKLSSLYYSLAGQYGDLLDLQKQYHYGQLGVKYAQKAHDKLSYAKSLFQLANAHHGFYDQSPKKYASSYKIALSDYKKILSLLSKEPNGSKLMNRTLFNLGSLYYEIKNYKNIDSAAYYYSLSKQLSDSEIGSTFYLLSRIMLAQIYIDKNNINAAEREVMEIDKKFPNEHDINDIQIRSNYYAILAFINEKNKNYVSAYQYMTKHKNLNDSLYSFNRVDEIKKIEAGYTNLKHIETLKRLQVEKENRKLFIIVMFALLFISLLAIYLLIRVNKIGKNKFALEKELLNQQKNDAELQQELQKKETVQYKLQAKIEQQQKEQLQQELMSSVMQVERKNDTLIKLKEKLAALSDNNLETKKISKLIDDTIHNESDFDKFRKNLENVYPSFFNKLQQQSNNTLTQLDLRYCAYILMALSTKEIANLLFIEPASVRITRYRIKQKLNLNKEEDLTKYITALV